jgi:hypothetical protein
MIIFSLYFIFIQCEIYKGNFDGYKKGITTYLNSTNTIYILFVCNDDGWTYSYMYELFPSSTYTHVTMKDYEIFKDNPIVQPRILVYNIENSGDDAQYTIVRKLLDKYKITILVHNSDEFQGSSRKYKYGEGIELYKYVPLVLREYSIWPYRNYEFPRSNVVQLPLGYMRGMLDFDGVTLTSTQAIPYILARKSIDRELKWSFIGSQHGHHDRPIAIATFSTWEPFKVDNGVPIVEVRKVYNNSKFVVVGRGQANLDCFRIYESIVSGAIPIVVGGKWEIDRVFEFEGDQPPFLFAENYNEALLTCQNMNDDEIDLQREKIVYWFTNRVQYIIKKVNLHLTVF